MSKANAAFALPPGDRDDAIPELPLKASAEPVAGREPADDFLATVEERLKALGGVINEAQFVHGELSLAIAQRDWPTIEAAASRLMQAFLIDPRQAASSLRRDLSRHRRELLAREVRTPQPEEV